MNEADKNTGKQITALKIGVIIVSVLLAIAIAGTIIFINRSGKLTRENERLSEQREQLQREIRSLNETVDVKDGIIKEQKAGMEQMHEDHKKELAEKDARIAGLSRRVTATGNRLEASEQENKVLTAEKEELEQQYAMLSDEVDRLNRQLEVTKASYLQLQEEVEKTRQLKVYNMSFLTKWERLICADRYNISAARRVDQTFIDFEVDGTIFSETGYKNVHLLLLDPDGRLMYPSAGQFSIAETGENTSYTAAEQFYYNFEPVKLEFKIMHPEKLTPGTYTIKAYLDGALSRTIEMVLD